MFEYTVHFQKGTRVGARSLRMERVLVESDATGRPTKTIRQIEDAAKALFPEWRERGYRITRVDHFESAEDGREYIVIDR